MSSRSKIPPFLAQKHSFISKEASFTLIITSGLFVSYWYSHQNRPLLQRHDVIHHCLSPCNKNAAFLLDKIGEAVYNVNSSFQILLKRYFRWKNDMQQQQQGEGEPLVLNTTSTPTNSLKESEEVSIDFSNDAKTTANGKQSSSAKGAVLVGPDDGELVDVVVEAKTTDESEEHIMFRDRSNSLFSTASTIVNNKRPVVELLVHNVSHSDIVLSLGRRKLIDSEKTENDVAWPTTSAYGEKSEEEEIFCRPRFSAFDLFSRRVFAAAISQDSETLPIISFPRYERSDSSPRYTLVTPLPSRQKLVPVGFALTLNDEHTRIEGPKDMASLRIRGKDLSKVQKEESKEQQPYAEVTNDDMFINGVFLPLLAPLILTWVQRIEDKYHLQRQKHSDVKMVVILVTGVGTPRNWTHTVTGNSTEFCAKIMELFLHILHPNITVVKIHSETNLFRYDENISFAKRELMPCIEAYRDAHATGGKFPDEELSQQQQSLEERKSETVYNPDWRESFNVTLSFADGSLARAHAIQAALRPYRPTYFHFWQLKTFWHESKISEEDIEILTFEDMETVPAMEVSKTSEKVQLVVAEMLKFKNDFLKKNTPPNRSDLRSFWLRKTQKPVLAVLLVQTPDGKPLLYRGTNMEVSMPTGSLCAERCVIGSALANNPGLKRENLKMIAVLAVPLLKVDTVEGGAAKLVKNGVDNNDNISGVIPSSIEANYPGIIRDYMLRSNSIASLASIRDEEEFCGKDLTVRADVEQQVVYEELTSIRQTPPVAVIPASTYDEFSRERQVKHINMYTDVDVASDAGSDYGQQSRSKRPVMGGSRMQKTKLVVHHEADLNPLRPCGSCNEWLKKIAEPNPNFKILTFTDANCNGVYVTPCQF